MKRACPCPGFIVVKHIAHVFLKDLLPDLERRSPAEVGVGVVGISAPAPPFTLPLLCSSDAAVGVVLVFVAADEEDASGDTSAAVEDPVLGSSPSSVRGT